jgi:toxin-antitoxin system PIN domain toxin
MLSFDTNLVVYAANMDAPEQALAAAFLNRLGQRRDVVVCDLMLVEVYLKLRNRLILRHPLDAPTASAYCQALRNNANWQVVEAAPVMAEVWRQAATRDFALRRIIDARLALTLRHYGVKEFATTNIKDFKGFGFTRVWSPLVEK